MKIHKSLPFEVKSLKETGEFEGYASVFGNVDLEGDVIERGAFGIGPMLVPYKVKLFRDHDYSKPIGKILEAREDEYGLWVRGKVNIATRDGKDTYELMKAEDLDAMSIGANVQKARPRENGGRTFERLVLREISIVAFPANPDALIGAVKMSNLRKASFEDTLAMIELWGRRGQLCEALYWALESTLYDAIPRDQKITDSGSAIDGFKTAYMEFVPQFLDMIQPEDDMEMARTKPVEFFKSLLLEKAGRSISQKNKDRILQCIAALQELIQEGEGSEASEADPATETKDSGLPPDLTCAIDDLVARMRM